MSEDDVTRAKNQFKAMQLFGTDSTGGAPPTLVQHLSFRTLIIGRMPTFVC